MCADNEAWVYRAAPQLPKSPETIEAERDYSFLHLRPLAWMLPLALLLAAAPGEAIDTQAKVFKTPAEAARALFTAAQENSSDDLLNIFGPSGKELVSSGDDVADLKERTRFVASYQHGHKVVPDGADQYTLLVGTSAWPLPIPIVKNGSGWSFDAERGKQEVLFRRIGRNELDALKVCRAIIEAETNYARTGHDGNAPGLYTTKLKSDSGTEDGLYWEPAKTPGSPIGPLLAEAAGEDHPPGAHDRSPFHGYLYRILTSQGTHARGGAKDYLVDGKLTRGFAVVAYPVEYRASGVMTFIVDRQGKVYQKDLGPETATIAKSMTAFDPDPSWKIAD